MQSYRRVIAPKFATDLTTVHDGMAVDSPSNAAAVAGRIKDAVDSPKTVPHRAAIEAQPRGLRHPVRSVAVPPYIVHFRVDDAKQAVRVLRVRHRARQPLKRYD